jgi:hypothetical protein
MACGGYRKGLERLYGDDLLKSEKNETFHPRGYGTLCDNVPVETFQPVQDTLSGHEDGGTSLLAVTISPQAFLVGLAVPAGPRRREQGIDLPGSPV